MIKITNGVSYDFRDKNLLGSFVSFEIKNPEQVQSVLGETTKIKGLVTSVCFNLDGDHEICVKEFDDAENFHKLSEIESLNVAQIDPHAFFENIKLGHIEIEL